MKLIFDYAVELEIVEENPATSVATRFTGTARRRTRHLTPKEIRVYLYTVYGSNIRRQFKLALPLILLTLVRKSELLEAPLHIASSSAWISPVPWRPPSSMRQSLLLFWHRFPPSTRGLSASTLPCWI
jgi:hypothetical protein